MDENRKTELTREQLDEVVGEGGKKGCETVNCPHCGNPKELCINPGTTVTCASCGKQFEI